MEDEVIFRIEVEGDGESITTLESITKASRALREERKKLNLETDEGKKRIGEINQALEANDKKIKENVSSLEKQRLNIGNYSSALDKVIPGFSGFTQGIQGATTAGKAFISTPIGAVLAAVALALGAVVGATKAAIDTNDEFADSWDKSKQQAEAATDVIIRRVGIMGAAFSKLIKGDFSGAADSVKEAFTGVLSEIQRAIDLSGDLADRQNQLDDDLNKFNATEKARINTIKQLEIASKDASKTEEERIKLNQQAASLEEKLTKERTALTERQSAIEIEAIGLKNDIQKQANETTKEYGLRLLENSKIGGETAESIAKSIAAIDEAQSASIAKQEKLINQRNALLEKQREQEIKYEEEAAERAKEVGDQILAEAKRREEGQQIIKQEARALEDENIVVEQEEKEEVYIKDWKAYHENEKNKTKIAKLEEQQRLANLSSYIGLAKGLLKENTIGFKALAIAQATIDTYRAGASVIAETKGGSIARIIGMIAVISAGLANVAKIAGVKFQRGGLLYGPSHADGGIPFSVGGRLGFEAEGGEAIINKKSTSMFRPLLSRINQAGGGVPFARGGIADFGGVSLARASESVSATRSLTNAIGKMKFYVAVDEINRGQSNVQVVENMATVI